MKPRLKHTIKYAVKYAIPRALFFWYISAAFLDLISPNHPEEKLSITTASNAFKSSDNMTDISPVHKSNWVITHNKDGFILSDTESKNTDRYGPVPFMIQDSSGNDPIYGRYYINGHWGYFSSTDQWGASFTPPIYLEVLPFEHQEEFARVRTEAGWSLIDPGCHAVLQNCKQINQLPLVYTYGTGLDENNQAFIFEIVHTGEKYDSVSKIFTFNPSITSISAPIDDSFCIVNETGIADLTGYILLEPGQYEKVSFKQFPDTNCINETTYFFCEKDGQIQTITLDELKKLKYDDP